MKLEKIYDFIESNWGIKPKKIRYIEEGNSTYNWKVVDIENKTYVLRNAGKFSHYVRFQYDILNFLQDEKFPYQTPTLMRTKNSNFLINTKKGTYLFYRYIEGNVLRGMSKEDAYQIGRMLATYHKYIADFNWYGYKQLRSKNLLDKKKMTKFLAGCIRTVVKKTKKTELDLVFLSKAKSFLNFYSDILRKTNLNYYHSLPKIPCHGDLGKRNIIKQENRIIGFIDLGGITIDPPICDLQSCIQLNTMKNGQLDMNLAKYIINGYTSCRKLDRKQLKLIPSLIYSEMLKTLCWIMSKLATPDNRINLIEASERIKTLLWLKNHYLTSPEMGFSYFNLSSSSSPVYPILFETHQKLRLRKK